MMKLLAAILGVVLFASCNPDPPPTPDPSATPSPTASPASLIQHVVIIIQENRSVDNLFQGFPGANTQSWGLNLNGKHISLKPVNLDANYDPNHTHTSFLNECNKNASGTCQMNGWKQETCGGGTCPDPGAYGYVPQAQAQPYWNLAQAYAFSDSMFQTNQGPSFPAHQYLVSGTSTIADGSTYRASENISAAGCDAPVSVKVLTIDPAGVEGNPVPPCFNRSSIFTLLDAAGLTWKYYQDGTGANLWHAPDALKPLCPNKPCVSNPEFAANVITNPSQFLTDIGGGSLAAVTYITPTAAESDHAASNNGTGPAWVTSVVNAIGNSSYWGSTAIIFTYDDWGGWYDHQPPTGRDSYELSFRVPLVIVSPYAKNSYISHVPHEFGSILKYIEENFGLPSLNTTDVLSDDLSDMFDYTQTPTPFVQFAGSKPISYWKAQHSTGEVDY